MKNIILIGFMGTGKTCVGQLLAQMLGWQFVDLDAQVEQKTGMTIADYFSRFWRAAFRDREAEACWLLPKTRSRSWRWRWSCTEQEILTGLSPVAYWCVYPHPSRKLWPGLRTIRRVPLLNRPDRLQVIRDLLAARESQYRQAEFWLETDGSTALDVADEIRRRLAEKGWFHGTDSN